MAEQDNNLVLYESGKFRTINTGSDTLKVSVDTTIDANLTVTGTTTTVHSETVLIKDNFLDLNHGYASNTAQQGGITINYDPDTAASTTSTAFTAGSGSGPVIGVASASGFANFDVIQVSNATDPANDGIYILKSISGTNFTLMGTGGTSVPAIHSWAKNQLTTNGSDTAATVVRVAVSIMKANTSGDWQVGKGSNITNDAGAGIAYSSIQTGEDSSTTLQQAYAAGQTITTNGTSGALTFAGDQLFAVSTTGGLQVSGGALDVNTSIDFDGTTLDAVASSAISLDAGAASNFTTSSGELTLSGAGGVSIVGNASEIDLTTTGALDVNVGSVDLDSSGTIDIDGTVSTLKGSTAVVIGQGSSVLQIASSGALTDSSMASYAFAPSGAFNVTAGASSTLNVTGTLALVGSTGHSVVSTGGTYLLNAAGRTIDMDCATFDLDATGAVQITGASDSTIQMNSADLDLGTVTSGDININSAGDLDLDGATVNIDSAGALSLDGAGASNLTTSSGALTLSGAGGLNLAGGGSEIDITSAGAAVDINAGSLTIDTTGNIDINGVVSTLNGSTALVMKNGSAAVQIASGALTDSSMASYAFGPSGAFNVTAGASSTLSVTGTLALVGSTGHSVVSTGGTYLLNAAGQTIDQDCATFDVDATGAVNLDGAAASQINVTSANLTLKTTTSGEIQLDAAGYTRNRGFLSVNGDNPSVGANDEGAAAGMRMVAGNNISANAMVCWNLAGTGVVEADASSLDTSMAVGTARAGITSGNWGDINSVQGQMIEVIFDSAPALADRGKRVYLSETAGKVTLTPPITSGAVVFQVGMLAYRSGNATDNLVHFQPQFIIENP